MLEFDRTALVVLVFSVVIISICFVRLRKTIQEYTFCSGLVAGDSFQTLSASDLRARRLEQQRTRATGLGGGGRMFRALSSNKFIGDFKQELSRRSEELQGATKKRLGGELFRSRGDLQGLQMSSSGEAVTAALTDAVRQELRLRDVQGLNFSGTWVVDRERSSSLDLHLKALGVPWIARAVANKSKYTAVIDHHGLWWSETATTSVVQTTTELRLDGLKQIVPHPMDKSECLCDTTIEITRVFVPDTIKMASSSQVSSAKFEHGKGCATASLEPVVGDARAVFADVADVAAAVPPPFPPPSPVAAAADAAISALTHVLEGLGNVVGSNERRLSDADDGDDDDAPAGSLMPIKFSFNDSVPPPPPALDRATNLGGGNSSLGAPSLGDAGDTDDGMDTRIFCPGGGFKDKDASDLRLPSPNSSSVVVTQVTGRAGWFLDQVTLGFSDGADKQYGKKGGGAQPPLDMLPGEHLVSVQQCEHEKFLGKGLTLITSNQRLFRIGGDKFRDVLRLENKFETKEDRAKQAVKKASERVAEAAQETHEFDEEVKEEKGTQLSKQQVHDHEQLEMHEQALAQAKSDRFNKGLSPLLGPVFESPPGAAIIGLTFDGSLLVGIETTTTAASAGPGVGRVLQLEEKELVQVPSSIKEKIHEFAAATRIEPLQPPPPRAPQQQHSSPSAWSNSSGGSLAESFESFGEYVTSGGDLDTLKPSSKRDAQGPPALAAVRNPTELKSASSSSSSSSFGNGGEAVSPNDTARVVLTSDRKRAHTTSSACRLDGDAENKVISMNDGSDGSNSIRTDMNGPHGGESDISDLQDSDCSSERPARGSIGRRSTNRNSEADMKDNPQEENIPNTAVDEGPAETFVEPPFLNEQPYEEGEMPLQEDGCFEQESAGESLLLPSGASFVSSKSDPLLLRHYDDDTPNSNERGGSNDSSNEDGHGVTGAANAAANAVEITNELKSGESGRLQSDNTEEDHNSDPDGQREEEQDTPCVPWKLGPGPDEKEKDVDRLVGQGKAGTTSPQPLTAGFPVNISQRDEEAAAERVVVAVPELGAAAAVDPLRSLPSTPAPSLPLEVTPLPSLSRRKDRSSSSGSSSVSDKRIGGGGTMAIVQCKVVTRTQYTKHGHTQVVKRWLEDDGNTYVVTNDLSLVEKGVILKATIYFKRIGPNPDQTPVSSNGISSPPSVASVEPSLLSSVNSDPRKED